MRRWRERGSITAEALIWIPVLVYLAFMTLDFGLALHAKTIVTEATREAARDASVSIGCPDNDTIWGRTVNPIIHAALNDRAPAWGNADSPVPGYAGKTYFSVRCFTSSGRKYVEVEVNYLQEAIAPWLPRIVGGTPNPDYWLITGKLVVFDER